MSNSKRLSSSKGRKGVNKELDWFELVFGFKEDPLKLYERDNEYLSVQYNGHDASPIDNDTNPSELKTCPTITCKKTGEIFQCGFFSTPSLNELRERNRERLTCSTKVESRDPDDDTNVGPKSTNRFTLSIEIGDAATLHEKYPFSTIQVASQLNCLEFVSPTGDPESGVTKYSKDHTQGPACCLCTAPAIVYRNYYHPYKYANGDILYGQTKNSQWNNLVDIERMVGNEDGKYWTVQGGYTMSEKSKFMKIPWSTFNIEELKGLLRIGIHADTQITSCGNWGLKKNKDKNSRITHVLSSACAIGYNGFGIQPWKELANIVLQATYEATLYAGLENYIRNQDKKNSNIVLLTLVGGGVFGNPSLWILEAIEKACLKFQHTPLNVRIVSFNQPDKNMVSIVNKINKQLSFG